MRTETEWKDYNEEIDRQIERLRANYEVTLAPLNHVGLGIIDFTKNDEEDSETRYLFRFGPNIPIDYEVWGGNVPEEGPEQCAYQALVHEVLSVFLKKQYKFWEDEDYKILFDRAMAMLDIWPDEEDDVRALS